MIKLLLAATDQQMGVGFAVVVGLMGALLMGIKLKKSIVPDEEKVANVKLSPSPLSVEIIKTLATKDELDEFRRAVSEDFKEVDRKFQVEREAARVANGKLHARNDKVLEAVAEMRGEIKQVAQSLNILINKHIK